MALFEYQIGFVVEAEDEQEAYKKIHQIMDLASDLDFEGDPALDGPFEWASATGILRMLQDRQSVSKRRGDQP
jgi:hypothetical protein